jgi:hypothetical protein
MTKGDWEHDPKLGSRTQKVIWTLNPLSIFPGWTLTPLSTFPARLLSRLLKVNTNVGSHVTRCKRSLSTIPCHASQKFNEVRTCKKFNEVRTCGARQEFQPRGGMGLWTLGGFPNAQSKTFCTRNTPKDDPISQGPWGPWRLPKFQHPRTLGNQPS